MGGVSLKIDGIYDDGLWDNVIRGGITFLGFDFRPRSMNFLPEYRFLEWMETRFSTKHSYFLKFDHENPLFLEKIVNDLSSSLGGEIIREQFFFEFEFEHRFDLLKELPLKLSVYFREGLLREVSRAPENFRYLVLTGKELEEASAQNRLGYLWREVFEIVKINPQIELVLKQEWRSSLLHSAIDMLPIRLLSLEVNNEVEEAYRVPNHLLIKKEIEHWKRKSLELGEIF